MFLLLLSSQLILECHLIGVYLDIRPTVLGMRACLVLLSIGTLIDYVLRLRFWACKEFIKKENLRFACHFEIWLLTASVGGVSVWAVYAATSLRVNDTEFPMKIV